MKVIYECFGCEDIRFFKDEKEFNEWLERQLIVQPDTKIINTRGSPNRGSFFLPPYHRGCFY